MRRALVLMTSLASASALAQPKPPIVLKAARLFDARAGRIVSPGVIVVTGDKITSVGTPAPPSGATVIDLGDATLLPGFMDAHTHVTGEPSDDWKQDFIDDFQQTPAEQALYAVEYVRRTLMAGFTTVRNVGAGDLVDVALRNAIRKGKIVGPRMIVATTGLGTTGGHCDDNRVRPGIMVKSPVDTVADGPDALRAKVREAIRNGADVIKFCATGGVLSFRDDVDSAQLTQAEMSALIDEAHARKRKVAAHAHGAEGAYRAIVAGVDSIEHGSFLTNRELDLMKRKGTYLVPTALALQGVLERLEKGNLHPDAIPKAKAAAAKHRNTLRNAVARGVRIAFGTDAGVFKHGRNAEEFHLLVEGGLKPADALRAATIVDAQLLGVADTLGTLEPGKIADVIAVPGDPLKDIRVTEKVVFVMKEGIVYRNDRQPGMSGNR